MPRKKYAGRIEGFVFKMGDEGLGYYRDHYKEWMASGSPQAGASKGGKGRFTTDLDSVLANFGGVGEEQVDMAFDDEIASDVSGICHSQRA